MVDAPATSRADQTGTGLKGRISQNLQDLIRLKASLCVKRRFSSLRRRGATLTSLREVCEITDLLSVGGGNLQRGESGMNRFGVTLRFHDVFFCGFVPLFLAVFSNFLLPMLNHSRGKKREFFWGEKKTNP